MKTYQKHWDDTKAVPRQKSVGLSAYIRKQEKSQIN